MRDSGGREWVGWLKKRFYVENKVVSEEVARRGLRGKYQTSQRGGVDISMHAWEVVERYPKDDRMRQDWGF